MGGYRLGRALGRGAVATVFAVDGGEALALKRLNPDRSARAPLSAERFLREARAASRLDHPHIARIVDHGVDASGAAYLVMERVEGETLAARLARGPMPVDEALTVTAQLASALAHAHTRGVVHRDVKPANVLLEPDPVRARLVDFGLARDRHDLPLTVTGALCGTPHYMAPELVEGVGATSASDVYALGCVLFEMLTGRPPFTGALPHVFRGHAYEPAPEPSTLRPEAAAADALLSACLAKDPSARPGCAALERACLEARDPVAAWTDRLDALAARAGADPAVEVADALRKAHSALERLRRAPDVAGGAAQTVVRPGRAHALAQLAMHAAAVERALGE